MKAHDDITQKRPDSILHGAARAEQSLLKIIILILTPAFCFSCNEESILEQPLTRSTEIHLAPSANTALSCIDLFFFNDDELQRLDSYQRIESPGTTIYGASRIGDKLMVAIANSKEDKYSWARVNSYSTLKEIMVELRDESSSAPVMTGEYKIRTGTTKSCTLKLEPLLARVLLESLSCDFSGKPYAGERLQDVRVYLTNVSGSHPLFYDDGCGPSDLLCSGRYFEEELEEFRQKDLLCKVLQGEVGSKAVKPGIELFCYPNEVEEEGPGTPFTRLVIEGKMAGTTYYYPLSINRMSREGDEEMGRGISRNRCYKYDIKITRLGATDPDTSVEVGTMGLTYTISEYKDGGEHVIEY